MKPFYAEFTSVYKDEPPKKVLILKFITQRKCDGLEAVVIFEDGEITKVPTDRLKAISDPA